LIQFLGNDEFWVRLMPALIGGLTLLVVWKTVESLGGNLFALSLSAIALIFSAMARLNILFQPNSMDILCWTLVLFTLVRYFQSEQPKWIYLLALSFAFGFLNKYNIAFLGLGLLPALILTSQRSILSNRHLYFALILALLLISPNLNWQWENGFPILFHMQQLSKHQ
jgi:4-amino-4-deoxy-L-arabinose transferase-like glycosyltransferase